MFGISLVCFKLYFYYGINLKDLIHTICETDSGDITPDMNMKLYAFTSVTELLALST